MCGFSQRDVCVHDSTHGQYLSQPAGLVMSPLRTTVLKMKEGFRRIFISHTGVRHVLHNLRTSAWHILTCLILAFLFLNAQSSDFVSALSGKLAIPETEKVWERVQAPQFGSNPPSDDGEPTGATYFVFERVCPERIHFPPSRITGVLYVGMSPPSSCNNSTLFADVPSEYCESEDCHVITNNLFFKTSTSHDAAAIICVACSDWLRAALRRDYDGAFIAPSADDYQQMVWLESISHSELLVWDKVSFTISVISTCRMDSLRKLLSSLASSFFLGDRVDLYVSLDTSPTQECLDFLSSFEWLQGSFQVRRRIRASGGPEVAVPEGLGVNGGDGHYGVLLEDDILVSDQFYSWLKFVGLQLNSYPRARSRRIFSISLYTPRVLETGKERRTWIDYQTSDVTSGTVFLFEVPCSWGSAFSSTYWSKALSYFEVRLTGTEVYQTVRDSKASTWKGSWKKWLIELGYHLHWTTVYPVFQGETSFSTNTLQDGKHMVGRSALDIDMFMVPLFTNNSWYSQLKDKRLFQQLRGFDLYFSPQKEILSEMTGGSV